MNCLHCGNEINLRYAKQFCSLSCRSTYYNLRRPPKYGELHGWKSQLYNIWKAMHFRCYYPSHEAYPRYGGSGVTVCDEWRQYLGFKTWALSAGYEAGLTIDRIDNARGYEPQNCRWIPLSQQNRNRRDNIYLTAFGETKLVTDWAEDPRCMVSRTSLYRRLRKQYPPEIAITHYGERKLKSGDHWAPC